MKIDPWYGEEQYFGHLGTPQRWVNLLGTVTGGAAPVTLTWQLQDSAPASLNLGPDGLRLRGAGDYNVEIPVTALREGANLVHLQARDGLGNRASRDVVLHYVAGRTWPLPYTVDFTAVPNVDAAINSVQVVDGRWRLRSEGIRPENPAYDRLITFGDVTWRDYRVTIIARIHSFVQQTPTPQQPNPGLMGGFGLLFRWSGHHVDEHQPHREWRPNGAIGWYRARWEESPARRRCLNISDAVIKDESLVETPPLTLDPARFYAFEFAVRSHPDAPSRYRYRVWPVGKPERLLCDLTTRARPGEAPQGSVLIISLYADVTIARLEAVPVLTS